MDVAFHVALSTVPTTEPDLIDILQEYMNSSDWQPNIPAIRSFG